MNLIITQTQNLKQQYIEKEPIESNGEGKLYVGTNPTYLCSMSYVGIAFSNEFC